MNTDNILVAVAIIAVVVSAVGVGFTYYTIMGFQSWITGLATDNTATANVTITSSATVNFTTDNINWGSGTVDGPGPATLNTHGSTSGGTSFTSVSQGFVLENLGNVNVTLDLATGKTNNSFIGGTNPSYKFNITNIGTNACINSTSINLGEYYDVNITSPGTRVCDIFQFLSGSDNITIDITITIPVDSAPEAKGDTMTATATAI